MPIFCEAGEYPPANLKPICHINLIKGDFMPAGSIWFFKYADNVNGYVKIISSVDNENFLLEEGWSTVHDNLKKPQTDKEKSKIKPDLDKTTKKQTVDYKSREICDFKK